MKKILFLVALFTLMGGVNSVKAKTLDVDLSKLPASSENTTWSWDAGTSTGTFAWSNTSWNSMELYGSGNYSAYQTLNLVTAAGTADHFRIIVKFTNGTGQLTINPVAVGTTSITLLDHMSLADLANIQTIRLSGANDATGDITVSSIYLEGPDVNYIEASEIIEAPSGTTDAKSLTGSESDWQRTDYPAALGDNTILFGNGDGGAESTHQSISGYDYMNFAVTNVSSGADFVLRVWVWDGSKVVTLYPHLVSEAAEVGDWTSLNKITSAGDYTVKVTSYNDLKGVKSLAYWQGSAGTITVKDAFMSTGDPAVYVPSGKYSLVGEVAGAASLTSALADANAIFYDATGVTGTSVDLTSVANSNALFKANSGALANTSNVIVGSTCASLELTDGNYPFKAPADFTATSVSYNRTFTVDQPSTVCLPFALAEEEVAAAGTFYELTDYSAETLTFSEVATTAAYKPYLFKAKVAEPFTSYSGKAVGETPADLSVTAGDATMTGTMARQSVNGKYGWNSANGAFSKATSDAVTIDPFRAYITINGASSARVAARFVGGSVTGINEVSEAQNVLNPDGKYIENGKIVIVKNGVKYNAAGAKLY